MALAAPGVGSNLDVDSIITQLMNVERRPALAIDRREASFQARLTAFGNLKGALSTFQSALRGLGDISRFQSYKATSSDDKVLAANASATASAGSYTLSVSQLAQSQTLASVGQASTTAAIGTGTISFSFGTISGGSFDSGTGKYTGASFTSNGNAVKTVTIDATQNSLAGIRDAINAADIGVSAAIVNDGGTSPYRLTLSVSNPGLSNSLKISVSGDAGLQSLLAHDPAADAGQNLSQTAAAQNAEFTVNGVAVSKSSNTVADVIEGVTLNLLKVDGGTPTTVKVARDTASVRTAIEGFAKAYNDLGKVITDLGGFNAETRQGGILQGDSAVRTIQSQIRATLGRAVTGAWGGLQVLSQIGLSFQSDGTIAVDSAKLNSAIDTQFGDIAALFARGGKASDSLVRYVGGGEGTRPGSYLVNVTQLATQGKAVGSATVAAGYTVNAGVNDTLSLSVDGVSTTVTLSAGSYATVAALAAEIQSQVNGASALSEAGAAVAVTESAGVLTVTSAGYGSESTVSVSGGTAYADLFGGATATDGVDAAGTINGAAATGSGRFLTASSGDAAGLKLEITGGSLGSRGSVSYAHGYAYQLDELVEGFLASSGTIASRTDGIDRAIKGLDSQREVLNRRLESIERRYRAQFTALDQLVSSLNTTSSFLAQQLANLPSIG